VPTGSECQSILIRCWRRPSYLVYLFVNLALYGILASQWINESRLYAINVLLSTLFWDFNTINGIAWKRITFIKLFQNRLMLIKYFNILLFTLKLVGFFPMRCSPHGLLLSFDSTFTKHELLFVLSLYAKYWHTSLSRLRPATGSSL